MRTFAWIAVGVLGLSTIAGCAETPPRPNLEDKARRVAPLPACLMYLPPTKSANAKAFIRQLREDEYWKLVFPSFDAAKWQLANNARDCVGHDVFTDWQFQGADPLRGNPLKAEEGDIVFGGGGDRLKVIWMRTHHTADGDFVGPIAMVRTMENFVEVYGVGVLKGRPDHMNLALERLGPEVILTATDDGCTKAEPGVPCETRERVFLTRKGRMIDIADIPLERRAFAINSEPGVKGKLEYRLTTAPLYKPGLIQVFEKIAVKDERGLELRKAELARTFTLLDDGRLWPSEEPLWGRVFNNGKPSPKAKTTPPKK